MKITANSGNNAESYVLLPELSRIICDGEELSRITSSAFATAGPRSRKLLLSARGLLNSAYPSGTFKCLCAEDIAYALEEICGLQSISPADGTYLLLPGVVAPPSHIDPSLIPNEVYRRITDIGGEITVNITDSRSAEFASRLLRSACGAASVSIVADRLIPSSVTDSASALWSSGGSVTFCNRTNAFKLLGFSGAPAVFDGAVFPSGDAVIRQMPLDPELFNGCTSPFLYGTVKAVTDEILSNEFSRRYYDSEKGRDRYQPRKYNPLSAPWFCCYKCAFQNPRNARTGAALVGTPKHDILLLRLGDIRTLDPCNSPRTLIKYFSAASTVFANDYPFRLIPYYRETVRVESLRELSEALVAHAETVCGLSVCSVLELVPSRSFEFPAPSVLSSLISGFFGLGGASIHLSKGGQES